MEFLGEYVNSASPLLTLEVQPLRIMVCGFSAIGALLFSTVMPLFIFGMIVLALAQAPQTAYLDMAKMLAVILGVSVLDGFLTYLSYSGFKNNCLAGEVAPPPSVE